MSPRTRVLTPAFVAFAIGLLLFSPVVIAPQTALAPGTQKLTLFLAFWGFVAILLGLWRVQTYRLARTRAQTGAREPDRG